MNDKLRDATDSRSLPADTLISANEIIRILRAELAAVCVAVGRSKDGTGYDVDWYELHKDVQARRSETREPIAYVVQMDTDGSIGDVIAPVRWATFNSKLEELKAHPWFKLGKAKIVPLYLAPQATPSATPTNDASRSSAVNEHRPSKPEDARFDSSPAAPPHDKHGEGPANEELAFRLERIAKNVPEDADTLRYAVRGLRSAIATPAMRACRDIFNDFDGWEIQMENASVQRAWEIGKHEYVKSSS